MTSRIRLRGIVLIGLLAWVSPCGAQLPAPPAPAVRPAPPLPAAPQRAPAQILSQAVIWSWEPAHRDEAAKVLPPLKPNQKHHVHALSGAEADLLTKRLHSQDWAHTLSRPQVMSLDGKTAEIQVGQRMPVYIDETITDGEVGKRVEYIDAGLHLKLTAKVVKPRVVQLSGILERKAVDRHDQGVPVFVTRRTRFSAEVKQGQALLLTDFHPRDEMAKNAPGMIALIAPEVVAPLRDDAVPSVDSLQQEVRLLRQDVQRLIALLEERLPAQERQPQAPAAPRADRAKRPPTNYPSDPPRIRSDDPVKSWTREVFPDRPSRPRTSAATPPSAPAAMAVNHELRIGTFNFGAMQEKDFDERVMTPVAQALRRFELIVAQEVRTGQEKLFAKWVDALGGEHRRYRYVLGPQVGRTRDKRRMAFIYDAQMLSLLWQASLDNPADIFHWDPLAARFRARLLENDRQTPVEFTIINVQVDPDEVQHELKQLLAAINRSEKDVRNLILAGDFRAPAAHIVQLLEGNASVAVHRDTTNVAGDKMQRDNIVFLSRFKSDYATRCGIMDIQRELNLTNKQAAAVTPRHPVWLELIRRESALSKKADRYERIQILGPMTAGKPLDQLGPLSAEQLLAHLRKHREQSGQPPRPRLERTNVEVVVELLASYQDPKKFVPLIGPATLHHEVYRFKVVSDHATRNKDDSVGPTTARVPEVFYVDHAYYHLESKQAAAPPTRGLAPTY